MMLMLLWWILGKNKNMQIKVLDIIIKKKMYIRLPIISYRLGTFFNFNIVIFPVFMIPGLILVAKVRKNKHAR